MNADELRLLQAPVKARYKEHPKAARHTCWSLWWPVRGVTFNVLATAKGMVF